MYPERQYQNSLPVYLEILYKVSGNTLYKRVSEFFVIVSSSVVLKE